MILHHKQLARLAMTMALRIRRKAGYSPWDPICVYDLADQLGIEVRFWDIPSMEGIYQASQQPTIVVPSFRPPGRQVYNCGHEIGHHALGHGDQFDELIEDRTKERRFQPNEFLADCFAGELLMPKTAVRRGFALRGWIPESSPPESFYVVATWLGVGYSTLVHHLHRALTMLSNERFEKLVRAQPIAIRSTLLEQECRENLIVADQHWCGRAIDVQATDLILSPPDTKIGGVCAEIVDQDSQKTLIRAVRPGLGCIRCTSLKWSTYLRVTRKNYIGRAKYRFEEEINDGE